MPTKELVSVSPEKQKHRCGFCNLVLNKNDLIDNHSKSCVVCGKSHKIKPKCAFKLLSKATGSQTLIYQKVNPSTFDKTDVKPMCVSCKEKCFFCEKAHTLRSKYNFIHYLFSILKKANLYLI